MANSRQLNTSEKQLDSSTLSARDTDNSTLGQEQIVADGGATLGIGGGVLLKKAVGGAAVKKAGGVATTLKKVGAAADTVDKVNTAVTGTIETGRAVGEATKDAHKGWDPTLDFVFGKLRNADPYLKDKVKTAKADIETAKVIHRASIARFERNPSDLNRIGVIVTGQELSEKYGKLENVYEGVMVDLRDKGVSTKAIEKLQGVARQHKELYHNHPDTQAHLPPELQPVEDFARDAILNKNLSAEQTLEQLSPLDLPSGLLVSIVTSAESEKNALIQQNSASVDETQPNITKGFEIEA